MTRMLGACSHDGRALALKQARVQLARRTRIESSRSNGRGSSHLTVLDGGVSARSRPARSWLPIRVVLAEPVGLVRAGLRSLLEGEHDITVAGAASSGEEAVALVSKMRPDVVLIDIRLPGLGGLATMRRILADSNLSQVRVVILTADEREADLFGAVRSGASGFLLLDTEAVELLRAVRVVAGGGAQLSPWATRRLLEEFATIPDLPGYSPEQFEELTTREREIVSLVATGLSNGEIAQRLVVSPATVKTHVSRAMLKLHARDRAKLVALAHRSGFVRHHRAIGPSVAPDRSVVAPAAAQKG